MRGAIAFCMLSAAIACTQTIDAPKKGVKYVFAAVQETTKKGLSGGNMFTNEVDFSETDSKVVEPDCSAEFGMFTACSSDGCTTTSKENKKVTNGWCCKTDMMSDDTCKKPNYKAVSQTFKDGKESCPLVGKFKGGQTVTAGKPTNSLMEVDTQTAVTVLELTYNIDELPSKVTITLTPKDGTTCKSSTLTNKCPGSDPSDKPSDKPSGASVVSVMVVSMVLPLVASLTQM
jgi:hypothetical protein